ncbi:MAG: hypothetical protein IKR19_07545 [Acholeplasmatales bacterium]|nr:hypothetical protein [Acholeplasmatales bacterium]
MLYKSLYPSIIAENNIAPNTQIGRIEIDEKVYPNENVYKYELYSRGGEFVENMVTDNHIEFCHRWFGLASVEEFISDMDEYYSEIGLGRYSDIEKNTRSALIPTSNRVKEAMVKTNSKINPAVIFYNERDKSITFDTLAKEKI